MDDGGFAGETLMNGTKFIFRHHPSVPREGGFPCFRWLMDPPSVDATGRRVGGAGSPSCAEPPDATGRRVYGGQERTRRQTQTSTTRSSRQKWTLHFLVTPTDVLPI